MPLPLVGAAVANIVRTYGTSATLAFPAAATAFAVGAGLQDSTLQANLQSKGNAFVNEISYDAGKIVSDTVSTVSSYAKDAYSYVSDLARSADVPTPIAQKSQDNTSTIPTNSQAIPTPEQPSTPLSVDSPRPSATPPTQSSNTSTSVPITPPSLKIIPDDTLISVLKENGKSNFNALVAIAKVLVESSSYKGGSVSIPSYGASSSLPSEIKSSAPVSAPYTEGYYEWSEDGNSLVVVPSTTFEKGVGEAVVSGNNISSLDISQDLKDRATNVYSELGLKSQNSWYNGLTNVATDDNNLKYESGVINRYLDGALTRDEASDQIARIRNNSLIPIVDVVETVKTTDAWGLPLPPNMQTVVSRVETPRTAGGTSPYAPIGSIPYQGSSYSGSSGLAGTPVVNVTVPPSAVTVSPPAAIPADIVINNTLDIDGLIAPVQSIADSMPDKAKADAANVAMKEIPEKMADKEKVDRLITAKQESLDYASTGVNLTLIDNAPATLISPRDATFLAKAHEAIKIGEINNMKFDDIDLGLGGAFSSLMELGYTGVYDSIMSASASLKEANFEYDTSFSESSIPLFALSAALS